MSKKFLGLIFSFIITSLIITQTVSADTTVTPDTPMATISPTTQIQGSKTNFNVNIDLGNNWYRRYLIYTSKTEPQSGDDIPLGAAPIFTLECDTTGKICLIPDTSLNMSVLVAKPKLVVLPWCCPLYLKINCPFNSL